MKRKGYLYKYSKLIISLKSIIKFTFNYSLEIVTKTLNIFLCEVILVVFY